MSCHCGICDLCVRRIADRASAALDAAKAALLASQSRERGMREALQALAIESGKWVDGTIGDGNDGPVCEECGGYMQTEECDSDPGHERYCRILLTCAAMDQARRALAAVPPMSGEGER